MELRKALTTLFSGGDGDITSLNLRGGLESPSVPLGSPTAFSLALGTGEPSASGEIISERNALENPTVYTCVTLIASGVAAIPFKIFQIDGHMRTEAADHSLSYLIRTQPNPEMTAFTFFETLAGCAALTGNGYAEVERDGRGNVIALWPLSPLKTKPIRLEDGSLGYWTTDGMPDREHRVIPAADVIHIPMFGWDGLEGLSPIALLKQEIGLAQATLKAGARVFGNGVQTTGIVSLKNAQTFSPKQAQEVRESLEQQATGANRGRPLVLPGDWNYQQLTMTLTDAEFTVLRSMSRAMICAIWHVDPHFAGDTTRQAAANHEQATLTLIQDTFQPYMSKIQQEFRRKLLPRTGRVESAFDFGYDTAARLRSDIKTTLGAISAGRQWTVLAVDEARAMIGLNPIGGEVGACLLQPVNMVSADIGVNWAPAGSMVQPETTHDQPSTEGEEEID